MPYNFISLVRANLTKMFSLKHTTECLSDAHVEVTNAIDKRSSNWFSKQELLMDSEKICRQNACYMYQCSEQLKTIHFLLELNQTTLSSISQFLKGSSVSSIYCLEKPLHIIIRTSEY